MAARAADLMSVPVLSVGPQTPIAEVHALLARTRHRAVPVAQGDRLLGLALAADAERAERHKLGDRPIAEIMDTEPPVVAPDASLQAVIEGLAPPGPGRVLVVEAGRLVGHVSRSDLLEYLVAHPVAEPAAIAAATPRGLDASSILAQRWAPHSLDLLRSIGEAAGDRPLYLVGGAVRDLLLGRPSYDLDLMVVGDGIALARGLADKLGGKVTVHEPFGTATLELSGHRRLDVATARAESYERPGALPDIRPAALRADLERRDFTVNALAMRIDPARWGQVVDPFGGLRDLEAGQLRILHALSFVEDPARIVRAVRFERQLGLVLAPSAERAASYALSTGILDGVGGERLRLELRKLLVLPGVDSAVARLWALGGQRLVSGALSGAQAPLAALSRLEGLVSQVDEQGLIADIRGLRYRAALALVLLGLGEAEQVEAMGALRLAGHDETSVRAAIRQGPDLADRLPALRALSPSAAFEALRHLPIEVLAIAAAVSSDLGAADVAIAHQRARHLRLGGLDGHWLQQQGVEPGPLLGRILADTFDAVLDGKISGPDAERAYALRRARELAAIPL